MNIGVVAVAYGGYARFLDEFCEYISKSTIKPAAVTIVLGEGHGMTPAQQSHATELVPNIKFIYDEHPNPSIGRLTNLAIEQTKTEWITAMDIDDFLLPRAIETFAKLQQNADYLCIGYLSKIGKTFKYWQPATPEEIAGMDASQRAHNTLNNNSPFRRSLWEAKKFEDTNWYNLKFQADCVEQGARFVKVGKPVNVYSHWDGSLSKSRLWHNTMRLDAVQVCREMYARFERYYS